MHDKDAAQPPSACPEWGNESPGSARGRPRQVTAGVFVGPSSDIAGGCGPAALTPCKGESGAERSRTADLLNAIQALSQLSYSPTDSPTATG